MECAVVEWLSNGDWGEAIRQPAARGNCDDVSNRLSIFTTRYWRIRPNESGGQGELGKAKTLTGRELLQTRYNILL